TTRHRFQQLQEYFLEPATRPREDRRGAASVHPRPPLNLGIVEHLQQSVQELITHGRAVAPEAGPAPRGADVYDWVRAHAEHLAPEQAAVSRAIVYRQGLEHAIAAGDTDVIRQEPCPSCGCWGVAWHGETRRALCINRRCLTGGVPSAWTLAQLAEQAVRNGTDRRTGTG
ncbi:MAG: sle1, partial [Streptosporangiaceae bacterium]|nr:sle1 [Streptosporangiaceae bacterium]